jgi:nucleoid-associated protein YgaU
MATAPQPFLASAPATRVVRVTSTTLFALAARYYGDALLWPVIAQANGLSDPWVQGQATLRVPDLPQQSTTPTGLLT